MKQFLQISNMQISVFGILLLLIYSSVRAQDPRERRYMYPVLSPHHTSKPKVIGFAENEVSETLNRGIIVAIDSIGKTHISWRLLKNDDLNTGFNLYQINDSNIKSKLNQTPITKTTDFIFQNQNQLTFGENIEIVPVQNSKENINQTSESKPIFINSDGFISVKLNGNYMPNRMAIADLNGDGAYDFIIKQPHTSIDPGQKPDTQGTTYKVEAYLNDGTFLWRKDLGPGIEPGIWYSPFIAYDFDGDGKAEVAVKTSMEESRNDSGRVTTGPEYLSVWDGMTGGEICKDFWPERSDRYGDYNRNNRNQIGVAYLDGKTPCLLVARGTYKLMVLDAYEFNHKKLKKLWHWDGDEENPVIRHQGAHGMHCADIDGDSRDEVILGSVVIDDDGTALWSTGYGHPDKCFVTDIVPDRPGLEIFYVLEDYHDDGNGICLVDASNGKTIWNINRQTLHVGDGMVADIIPEHDGLECFAEEDPKGGSRDKYMLSSKGKLLTENKNVPDCRNWIFWDNDLLRETFSGNRRLSAKPYSIIKFTGETLTKNIEGKILMMADIMGDWREELITALPGEIRIYCTNIPASDKRVCLMQDRVYRIEVAHRSMGYEQSPVTSYYLGQTKK